MTQDSTIVDESYVPRSPQSIEEVDVPLPLVEDIILRHLYTRTYCNINSLSESLKLPFGVLMIVFHRLRERQLFEVTGMNGNDYRFTLTAKGRHLASERFDICSYSGPVPVSVETYFRVVRSQAPRLTFNREYLKRTFSDLVLTDKLLDQLGPALISNKAIFLYGPTGNGKTSIATRLGRIFDDTVLIPYAVEFDSQIIVVYDPSIHEAVDDMDNPDDARWVRCKRPRVFVGGELEQKMLDLEMEESSKTYAAPLQMKANNGVLVIDDFGRQIVSPHYLLNRWIVPLDSRIDYLTLRYGMKFALPFEMIVVFSTNLDPTELTDEAFLRRIQNKIYVESVSLEDFDQIFRDIVNKLGIPVEQGSTSTLRELCLKSGNGILRACYPADIVDIVRAISTYDGSPLLINRDNLQRAVNQYFTRTMAVSNDSE
ncbi:MAG: AAA family ATPase [Gammaproteobacteria bacterium]|nr:AAA family ATPase [Pseudomonadales bacterium]